jgi:hypothetical protein
VIVLLGEGARTSKEAPPEALGLFKDEPEIVDEMMKHVRELRSGHACGRYREPLRPTIPAA